MRRVVRSVGEYRQQKLKADEEYRQVPGQFAEMAQSELGLLEAVPGETSRFCHSKPRKTASPG